MDNFLGLSTDLLGEILPASLINDPVLLLPFSDNNISLKLLNSNEESAYKDILTKLDYLEPISPIKEGDKYFFNNSLNFSLIDNNSFSGSPKTNHNLNNIFDFTGSDEDNLIVNVEAATNFVNLVPETNNIKLENNSINYNQNLEENPLEITNLSLKKQGTKLRIYENSTLVEDIQGSQNQPLPEIERLEINAIDSYDFSTVLLDKTFLDAGEGIGITDGDDSNSSLKKRIDGDEILQIKIKPNTNYNSALSAIVNLDKIQSISTQANGGKIKIIGLSGSNIVGETIYTLTNKSSQLTFSSETAFNTLLISSVDSETKFTFTGINFEAITAEIPEPENPPEITNLSLRKQGTKLKIYENSTLVEDIQGSQNQPLPEIERLEINAIDSYDFSTVLLDKTFLDAGEGIGITDGDDGNSSLKKRIDGDEILQIKIKPNTNYDSAVSAIVGVDRVKFISSSPSFSSSPPNGGQIKIIGLSGNNIVGETTYNVTSQSDYLTFSNSTPFDRLLISAADSETKFTFISVDFEAIKAPSLQLVASLLNDTGISLTDSITFDTTIRGSVNTTSPLVSLQASFTELEETTRVDILDILQPDGSFILDITVLKKIYKGILRDGNYILYLSAVNETGNSQNITIPFILDTTAPTDSLLTPLVNGQHSTTARLIGTAIDETSAIVKAKYAYAQQAEGIGSGIPTDLIINNEGKFDHPLNLDEGNYFLSLEIEDSAGNKTEKTFDFQVNQDFLLGGDSTIGWGAKTSDTVILGEQNSFVVETAIPVELGQISGSRRLQWELSADFDTTDTAFLEDQIKVYLVDSNNPRQTLLDNGTSGTAVFSLAGDKAEFKSGLVRFDGNIVSIDVTSLGDVDSGLLVFQLLNHDSDQNSIVTIKNITNMIDESGMERPVFPVNPNSANIGSALDFSNLNETSTVKVNIENIHLNPENGRYIGALNVENLGSLLNVENLNSSIDRQVAVVFPNLPDEIELLNLSGTTIIDDNEVPYISLFDAIFPGGLTRGDKSQSVWIEFSNPNLSQINLTPRVFVGGANIAPDFEPLDILTVMPGDKLEIPLLATDANGDPVTFTLDGTSNLPTGRLEGNGKLIFAPLSSEIGTYTFNLVATDGVLTDTQTVTLNVIEDPITTTRISGVIQNINQEPLVGVPIELGNLQTITDANGSFILETSDLLTADTLKVRGELLQGTEVYPFIAEKLPLVLGQEVYQGVNNVITRPIYLPPIDVANAEVINPTVDAIITTDAIPFASVTVAAGSLKDQQGNFYTGGLSITQVPNDLTPAALPENLMPDLVVTIQPGEMVFTTPAPLSLPNLARYEPGTLMDLWSINPVTGLFDNVGTGIVSEDGTTVETISGGIRNSSWHFFTPQPVPGGGSSGGGACNSCKYSSNITSSVEFDSGTILENHDLVSYQSLGSTRGLTLTYDSLRADPRPLIDLIYPNIQGNPNSRLVGELTISQGAFDYQIPGIESNLFGLTGGEHIWSIPEGFGRVKAALQSDLSWLSSGRYEVNLKSGLLRLNQNSLFGSFNNDTLELFHVNSINSSFGSGWGLAGWQELVENEDGSVLLIDGDGRELIFYAPTTLGNPYVSPPGDFSILEGNNGIFRRTMKDGTVYEFNPQNKLAKMTDSNGNNTQYIYDGLDQLIKIIDPVGLETTFTYSNNRVDTITDPYNRITQLKYDTNGNLIEIIDPDNTSRTWEYDRKHHIMKETDKRNYTENSNYDFAGRAISALGKDDSFKQVATVQTQGLYPLSQTTNVINAPVAENSSAPISHYADGNGNVEQAILDGEGQKVSATDGEGFLPSVGRNENNLTTQTIDSRGNPTEYIYDSQGNVIEIKEELKGNSSSPTTSVTFNSLSEFTLGFGLVMGMSADFNEDSAKDLVVLNQFEGRITIWLGNNNGSFVEGNQYFLGGVPSEGVIGDVNRDGILDLVIGNVRSDSNNNKPQVSLLLGVGDGTFSVEENYFIGEEENKIINALELLDLNNDDHLDIIAAIGGGYGGDDVISVLLSDGNGSFDSPNEESVGDSVFPSSLAVGDVNGDGNKDVVVTKQNNSSVSVFMGDGSGSLSLESDIIVGNSPTKVVLFDVNGDSHLDMIVANSGDSNVSVLLGDGNGTFNLLDNFAVFGVETMTVGDLNGDNFPDIVTAAFSADKISILLNNQDGTFANAIDLTVEEGISALLMEDLDNDNDHDLIISNSNNSSVTVYLNTTNSTFVTRQYTYDPIFNQVTTMTDELGRQTLYDIDPTNGNLLSMTRVVGEIGGEDDVITHYSYTTFGLIDTETDPHGRVTDYDYDTFGRLTQITFALNTTDEAIQSFEYDNFGNQTGIIDENGTRTEYEYDDHNRLLKTTYGVGTSNEAVELMEYDENGNQIATIDGNGNRTEYVYDTKDRLIKTIEADPDGSGPLISPVTINTYDNNGNLISTVDPLGRETKYIYDSRDRLMETILPDDSVMKSNYDGDNNLISSTNQTDDSTIRIYDSRSRLSQEIDVDGNTTTYQYDGANQLVRMVDGNGNTNTYEYDDLGRQIKVIDGEGNVTTTEYDKIGNVIAIVDGNGNRTEYEYDERDRQVLKRNVVPDGDDIITTMTYNDVGNLLSITDSENNTTTYSYDSRNRVISETNQLGFDAEGTLYTRNMTYDSANNQISITDRNNRLRTFTYDSLNRQIEEIWLDNNNLPIYSTTSSYNAGNEVVFITNPDANYSYIYDELGRILTVDNAGTPNVPNVVLTYDYDDKGNIISMADSIDGVAEGLTSYDYDVLDRVTTITQSGNNVSDKRVDFDYNAIGQYQQIDRFNDLTATNLVIGSSYDYDSANRLTDLIHRNSINNVAFYNLTYDAGSRITQIIDLDGTNAFDYDTRDQLLGATHSDVNNDDEIYSYDSNGNRTLSGYVTGENNELLSDGIYNYDYDNEGNLISQSNIATGEVRVFNWDYLNRLVAVTDFDSGNNVLQTIEFSYDMFGQRLSKIVDGVATYFVYDRDDVVLDFVDDGSGVELDMRYLHGNQVDEVLAQEDSSGNVTWLLRDQLGTIRDLVDNSGTVVNHVTYDSYGNVVSESDSTVDSRYRFTGREFDEEIDLYYYRARYYDSEIGRFISVDPIGFESGTYNLYSYVGNSPVNNNDPSGLASEELTRLLGVFKPVNKGGTVYHSKREYDDYSEAFIQAQNSFSSIIDTITSNGFLRSPKVPPNTWYINGLLKVNGNDVIPKYRHLEGGQGVFRPGGVSGSIPTIDLKIQRVKTSLGAKIDLRHHTKNYESATELKFIWKNSNQLCIILPRLPNINPTNTTTNTNNQQQTSPPSFSFPPIYIPQWLNPWKNPIF